MPRCIILLFFVGVAPKGKIKEGIPERDLRPKLRGRGFKKQIQFAHREGGEVDLKKVRKRETIMQEI